MVRDIHRIGGASIDNLRLKPQEAVLRVRGFSVLRAPSPGEAARQIRAAFPGATLLSESATTVASTNDALLHTAGFAIIHVPTRMLPNRYRLIHPSGLAGFAEESLEKLAQAFVTTTGH